MKNQSGKDEKADKFSTAQRVANMAPKCNAKIGSYASVAAMLDEAAKEPSKGVMLTSYI